MEKENKEFGKFLEDYLALSLIGVKGKGTIIDDIKYIRHNVPKEGETIARKDEIIVYTNGKKEGEHISFKVWGLSPRIIRKNFNFSLYEKYGRTIENQDSAQRMLFSIMAKENWCPFSLDDFYSLKEKNWMFIWKYGEIHTDNN